MDLKKKKQASFDSTGTLAVHNGNIGIAAFANDGGGVGDNAGGSYEDDTTHDAICSSGPVACDAQVASRS